MSSQTQQFQHMTRHKNFLISFLHTHRLCVCQSLGKRLGRCQWRACQSLGKRLGSSKPDSQKGICSPLLTPKPVSKPDSQKGICSPLLTPISSQCQKSLHSSTDMPLSLSPSRKLSLCPLTPSLFKSSNCN